MFWLFHLFYKTKEDTSRTMKDLLYDENARKFNVDPVNGCYYDSKGHLRDAKTGERRYQIGTTVYDENHNELFDIVQERKIRAAKEKKEIAKAYKVKYKDYLYLFRRTKEEIFARNHEIKKHGATIFPIWRDDYYNMTPGKSFILKIDDVVYYPWISNIDEFNYKNDERRWNGKEGGAKCKTAIRKIKVLTRYGEEERLYLCNESQILCTTDFQKYLDVKSGKDAYYKLFDEEKMIGWRIPDNPTPPISAEGEIEELMMEPQHYDVSSTWGKNGCAIDDRVGCFDEENAARIQYGATCIPVADGTTALKRKFKRANGEGGTIYVVPVDYCGIAEELCGKQFFHKAWDVFTNKRFYYYDAEENKFLCATDYQKMIDVRCKNSYKAKLYDAAWIKKQNEKLELDKLMERFPNYSERISMPEEEIYDMYLTPEDYALIKEWGKDDRTARERKKNRKENYGIYAKANWTAE